MHKPEEINLVAVALMFSLDAALEIVSLLPETDLCAELIQVLHDQLHIILLLDENGSFTEDDVDKHANKCTAIMEQIKRIRNAQ